MPAPGPLRLFSVPVYSATIDGALERRDRLARSVDALRRDGPGVVASNRHCWHSHRQLHQTDDEDLRWLGEQIESTCRALVASGQPLRLSNLWALVMQEGGWSAPHQHFPFPWSGVVYLNAEACASPDNDDHTGKLELINPIAVPERFGLSSGAVISPRDGMLVLFPGSLQHFVHPVRGTGSRVSFGFNLVAQSDTA